MVQLWLNDLDQNFMIFLGPFNSYKHSISPLTMNFDKQNQNWKNKTMKSPKYKHEN